MKFVKLIRPLFLVALGLHGLALFLPIGDASETADVEVAEDTVLAKRSLAPEKLPVPELDVSTEGNTSNNPFGRVLSPTAARPAAPTTLPARPGAATRSAPLAAAVPGATATRTTPTDNPIASADSLSGSPFSSAPTQAPANENSTGPQPSNSPEPSAGVVAEPDQGLIASATHQLPDSLRALMNRWAIALTYNPKGTDDSSAKTAQSKWMDKINAQASSIGVRSLESKLVEDFAQVSYPIESAVRDREQSFRVCLGQPPGSAEVGVLFDSQGEIVGEPELIRSTGYKAINEEVFATVEAAENFPEDRLSKAFIFEVKVDYYKESCVKLSDLKS